MILQRLATSLKRRDWGAAVIEVGIVVLGIFIGLQVDDWNDERNRAATSQAARASLLVNLRRDIQEFEQRQLYYQYLRGHGSTVLAAMNAPVASLEGRHFEFLESAYRLGQPWPFGQSSQVYRELQGKGDLDLIGGATVRVALAEYYDGWARELGYTVLREDDFRFRIRQLMPLSIQEYIGFVCRTKAWEGYSRLSQIQISAGEERCRPPEDPLPVKATAEKLAADPELHELARGSVAQVNTTLSVLNMLVQDAEILVSLIDEEPA